MDYAVSEENLEREFKILTTLFYVIIAVSLFFIIIAAGKNKTTNKLSIDSGVLTSSKIR